MVVGDESWFVIDHDVGHALLALVPRVYTKLQGEERGSWREELWTNAVAWHHLAARVHASVNRHCYRLLPGWASVEQGFFTIEMNTGPISPRDPRRLPCMYLRADGERIVDEVHTDPSAEGADWNDVLDEFGRAQEAAARQPCLVEWKRSYDVALALHFPRAHYEETCAARNVDLARRLGLAGTPAFWVSLGFHMGGVGHWNEVADGLLFEDGTLLILGGQAHFLPPGLKGWFCRSGRYGLVRPSGELEVRVVTAGAR